jgi:transposase-like protein
MKIPLINIKNLISDAQFYDAVRTLRWPDGFCCPHCESSDVIKRGMDETEPARQDSGRFYAHGCGHTVGFLKISYRST